MKTCDMIKLLLKATAAGLAGGLVTTAIAEGGVGFYSSIANLHDSVPEDGEACLAKMKHQRDEDARSALLMLLAFVPGFMLGALYYLSKQRNLCNPSALEYETIEDQENKDSITTFLNGLVSAENSLLRGLQILLVAIGAGLALTGVIYAPVKLASDDVDRSVFLPANCHEDMKEQNIGGLAMCLIIFVIISGGIFFASLFRSSKNENQETPAQLEDGSNQLSDSVRARHAHDDKSSSFAL